jgi:hypothetical protein
MVVVLAAQTNFGFGTLDKALNVCAMAPEQQYGEHYRKRG